MTGAAIQDPSRGFKVWHKSELYVPGGLPSQRFLPNVNDAVLEWGVGTYKVTAVNYTDSTYTLVKTPFDPPSSGLLDEDVLLGSGPGQTSESYRIYMNTETTPISVAFDTRLKIYSSAAHHVRIFRGEDISEATGHVISAVYNSNNVLIRDYYLLDLLVMPGQTNLAIKTPQVGSSIEAMQDGDVVTAVVYNVANQVLSHSKLLVRNTNFIRSTNASIKYITSIELLSNYRSATDNHKLEYPLNIPIQSDNLRGRVHYSDGSRITLPVDGTKFSLAGMNNYIASVLGQTVNLILTYNMSNNEYAYNAIGPNPPRYLTEPYTITTIQRDGIYSVKLFVVPRWVTTPTQKYVLDYYLYNVERDVIYDATPHVEFTTESLEFNGTSLGVRQELTVAINLQSLGTFNYFRHVQKFWITLAALGSNNAANGYWTIEYTDGNVFGYHLEAAATDSVTPGQWSLDVSNSIATENLWVAAMYEKIEALYIPHAEVQPPAPTHFRLRIGASWSREIAIADYGNLIDNITTEPVQGKAARLEFFKRTLSADLELGVASLTIQRT